MSVDETSRLDVLRNLNVLDTSTEQRFDRLVQITQKHFNVPIVLISLVEENRQWFKSSVGLSLKELPREISFCGHAILNDEILYVADTLKDQRFFDNPLVTQSPFIRSYAGAPLNSLDGFKLGTLCIIDTTPREFSKEQLSLLRTLADCVEHEINNNQNGSSDQSNQSTYLKAVLDTVADGIISIDPLGTIKSVNFGAEEMFLYSKSELIGANIETLLPNHVVKKHLDNFKGLFVEQNSGFDGKFIDIEAVKKNGVIFPIEISVTRMVINNEKQLICVVRDISKSKIQAEFLDTIVENIPNMLFVKEAKSLSFTLFNRAAEELLGFSREEMLGKTDYDLFPKEQADYFVKKDREVLLQGSLFDISEEPLQTKNKGVRFLHTRKISVRDKKGEPLYLLGISEDITEKKRLAEELFKQATLDSLTRVLNRTSLYKFLSSEIKRAQRNKNRLAVIYIDLDKFKPINDRYGHAVGDVVLQKVAERLQECVRESDCIARIGGDEFVIVLTDVIDLEQVKLFESRIIKTINNAIDTPKGSFSISMSIGVALYPDDGSEMEELLQKADQLMYKDKSRGS